jgi:histidinol-phosphate aminotransferase
MTPIPRPFLRRLEPYAPGEQLAGKGVIKLNTNEFPYPPAPAVLEAIRSEAGDSLRRYPSSRADALRHRIAQRHGVRPEQVFVGNGSDEVLRLLIQAYGGPGRLTATLSPTYSLYRTLVEAAEGEYQEFILGNEELWPKDLRGSAWDLFLLCVPNPPLGTLFDLAKVKYLSDQPGLLVLDEAYIEFADPIDPAYTRFTGPNIIRTRTFSKAFGLAGLRVGYAFGPEAVISEISKLADSYNVNRISQAASLVALESDDYYAPLITRMREDRHRLAEALRERGFQVPISHGNFVFARHPRARYLYEGLKARNILVRHFARPPLDAGLRISIGSWDELSAMLAAVDTLLAD